MSVVSLELWYQALASSFGVIIQTDDPKRCREKLYALREEQRRKGDLSLDSLSVSASPTNPGGELWIVKKKPDEET